MRRTKKHKSLYRKRSVAYTMKRLKKNITENFFKPDPVFIKLMDKAYQEAWAGGENMQRTIYYTGWID